MKYTTTMQFWFICTNAISLTLKRIEYYCLLMTAKSFKNKRHYKVKLKRLHQASSSFDTFTRFYHFIYQERLLSYKCPLSIA